MNSFARLRTVFGIEFRHTLKRPMFWSLIVVLAFLTWGMSTGNVRIGSGDASVGGRKAWITSEFTVAFILSVMIPALVCFFAAITAGLAILSDGEHKVGEILFSTRLRAREYVWGKALATLSAFFVSLGLLILMMIFFNHGIPRPGAEEIYGPLDLVNYVRPALVFGIPGLAFFIGVPFYLGARTRRPVVAFLFPIAVQVISFFFLWNWHPSWLSPKVDRLLMLVDPAGNRWLNQTWLQQDLGAEFYNTARIGLDLPFVLSRVGWLALGLVFIALTVRHVESTLRGGAEVNVKKGRGLRLWPRRTPKVVAVQGPAPVGPLVMTASPPGLLEGTLLFAREELGRLVREPAVYLFAFFIILQALGNALLQTGAFDVQILQTPGLLAAGTNGTLAFMVCLLLMFFTAESLQREQTTGTQSMIYSSPARSFSLLFGKALGNSALGVIMATAVFLGCAIALLIQGTVPLAVTPFLLVWGLLLLPTFLLWTAFVTAIQAVTGNRYATYGVALAAFGFTAYKAIVGELTWVTNWPLWGAVRWSDMSVFELDRRALLLNRLLALTAAVFFCALAVRFFQRRTFDATRILHRLRPAALGSGALSLAPWAAAPVILGLTLHLAVATGTEGKAAEKDQKDYWKQNLATWRDAENPSLTAVEVDLELAPEDHWLHSRGTYKLVNTTEKPMRSFALTGGRHWKDLEWTLDGEAYEPDDRSYLFVFEPQQPLAPGDGVEVGFELQGRLPDGITENGGGAGEFILPSGVVLNSFSPSFVPLVGYQEGVGVDDDNRYESREYPDNYYQERVKPFTGTENPFTTRVSVTAPERYLMNSVGILESDTTDAEGRRTVVWRSDHPVRFFNVVGGEWALQEGGATKIYYHPEHSYNVEEMSKVLEAARKNYSEWFYPYPWQELKISEFPAMANYAQGFATNIPFSEGIGFLTKADEKTDAVAMVTAHEAAHQWWGNLLTPGLGPGGNVLSEGMAHFSTMMLMEEMKGPRGRMEFAKRIEERYGDRRRKDAEKPLVKIDGSRAGDTTVTYDKGGWVFWMTLRHLGREAALEGIHSFIETYKDGPDYPLLQDFTATLRPFATDPDAFDRFADQWYHQVVLPELRFGEPEVRKTADGWKVIVEVEQAGTGTVPVEIAAATGERFTEDGEASPDYRDARTSVILEEGEKRQVEILADFEPERIVADPDVQLLQLRRNRAVVEL